MRGDRICPDIDLIVSGKCLCVCVIVAFFVKMSKTIETHLQSNEVRIPKKSNEFDVTAAATAGRNGGAGGGGAGAPCQYFKSSFARSLSFSQGPGGPTGGGGGVRGGGPYGGAEQHFTRSLDFDVNFDPIGGGSNIDGDGGGAGGPHQMMMMMMGTPSSASPVYEEEGEGAVSRAESDPDPDAASLLGGLNGIETSNGGIVKTLWNYAKGQEIKSANSSPAKRSLTLKSNGGTLGGRKSIEANEIEVLRLRKECQNLIEENRRLVSIASGAGNGYAISGMLNGAVGGSGSLSTLGMGVPNGGSYSSVESVILQTQVETLQWQLKQVDSSRHMYRAVMEEVVRFLDRCYRSLDALQSGQIGRSKSVLQVSKTSGHQQQQQQQHHHHDSDSSSASSPRARSSTNLVDVQQHNKPYTKAAGGGHNGRLDHQQQHHHLNHNHQPSSLTLINTGSSAAASQHAATSTHHEDDCVVPPSPASSYSTFRDFTWRRSPKRTQTLPISSNEVDPEKLAQEAFRLLRTVQNLLNTQEPTLAQSTNALDSLISASTAASSCGSSTTLTGVGLAASGAMLGSTPTLTGAGGGGNGGGDGGRSVGVANGHGGGGGGGGAGGGAGGGGSHPLVNTRSTVGFSRKLNMRGSRLSVRSSTADSVHSTSSSTKTETDEDNTDRPSPPLLLSHPHHHHHHHHLLQHQNGINGGTAGGGGGGGGGGSSSSSCCSSTSGNGSLNGNGHHHHNPAHRYSANIERIKEMMISSSAEDESGFSSMNSFQEIGLPLVNSTMLSSVGSSHGVSNGSLGGDGSSSSNEGGAAAGGGSSSSSTGNNSAFGGMSEDSSELRENTVIPTAAMNGATNGGSNSSANRLGIPSSPSAKSASGQSGGNSNASTVTGSGGASSGGSPLRVTQTASYEHHTHFINHRRWDSAPVVPPKLKIHAGETDTVSRVLWV